MDMSLAVIGYTGFVGSTICRQADVTQKYNSQNIEDICGRSFDTVICAGAPGAKWKANQNAAADLESISRLIANLRRLQASQFVLISTVDVYTSACEVDEATAIDASILQPYGRHRYYLEVSVRAMFPNATIVRLPGLFGKGLKKNFVFDLINGNALHLTHHESTFQFYNMDNLWADISVATIAGLPLVNFATEPVKAGAVARQCFGTEFVNETEKPALHYDMRTQLATVFGRTGPYLYSAEYTFEQIHHFAHASQELSVHEDSNLESRVGSI
jgi:nucleoside-diphosphate-sugar epimerase